MRLFLGLSVGLISTIACGMADADIRTKNAQSMLNALGYDVGVVDGLYGRKTATGLQQYYLDEGGEFDGSLDEAEIADLRATLGIEEIERPVIDWDAVDGNTRNDSYDCRDKQRGLVGIDDQHGNEADWVLNNDFGAYIWDETPALKSCLNRDGTGWAFNSGKARNNNGTPANPMWFAPAAVVGGKGFNSIGNMHNAKREFPVQVSSIESLKYRVSYTYHIEGVSNTHIALWFSEVRKPAFEGDPDAGPSALYKRVPELEVMLKIGNNSRDDERWKNRCQTNDVWTRYDMYTRYGIMPACLIGAQDNTSTGVKGLGVEGQFASSSIWFTDGWHKDQEGYRQRSLDLGEIIAQLRSFGFVKDEWYLMGIEFQTEVAYGNGQMDIHSLSYDLKTKSPSN